MVFALRVKFRSGRRQSTRRLQYLAYRQALRRTVERRFLWAKHSIEPRTAAGSVRMRFAGGSMRRPVPRDWQNRIEFPCRDDLQS